MATQFIKISAIDPDIHQPRKTKPVEYLRDELAVSIAERGLKNPIHVRENPDIPGRYWIVNGECRYTAVSLYVNMYWDGSEREGFRAGDDGLEIEAKICDYSEETDGDIFVDQIMDNAVRKDMGALETLKAIDKAVNVHCIPLETCAKAFGTSLTTLKADLPILGLPEILLREFDAGRLPKAVARKLATVKPSRVMKCYDVSRRGKDVASMLKHIEVFLEKEAQLSLLDKAKSVETNKDKALAKSAFSQLFAAMAKFRETPFADDKAGLLVNCNSRRITEIEDVIKSMKKISARLDSELLGYKAARAKAA